MMKDILQAIVVTPAPSGRFLEGYISGSNILPGTIMQLEPAVEPRGGRHTWQVYQPGADGRTPRGPLAVLLPDNLQSKELEVAYEDEDRCFLYVPVMGDELLVRLSAPGTGTGDNFAIGARIVPQNATGLCIADPTGTDIIPFIVAETVANVTATGTLTHVFYSGY